MQFIEAQLEQTFTKTNIIFYIYLAFDKPKLTESSGTIQLRYIN